MAEKMVKILDDVYSIIHVLFPIVCIEFKISVECSIIYSVYQLIDNDSVEEKIGDIIEYAISFVLYSLIKFFCSFSIR